MLHKYYQKKTDDDSQQLARVKAGQLGRIIEAGKRAQVSAEKIEQFYQTVQRGYKALEIMDSNIDLDISILEREYNPYVEAFWKWWPDLYKDLRVFRVTGGEPLLTKNTFKVLDYIKENPNPDLEVSMTTNMCPPDDALFDKFFLCASLGFSCWCAHTLFIVRSCVLECDCCCLIIFNSHVQYFGCFRVTDVFFCFHECCLCSVGALLWCCVSI